MKKNTLPTPSIVRFAVVATDVALFTIKDAVLHVRLMKVAAPIPQFADKWCLPGAVLTPTETTEDAARRVATERGQLDAKKLHLEQLATFSRLDRDPRGRVVAVAYLGLLPYEKLSEAECATTETIAWVPVAKAKKLAYDHDDILATALTRIRARVHYTTLISKLMAKEFTLTQLETAFETVTGSELDKRNFRKKILKLGILEATGKKRTLGPARPAELYRFASQNVADIEIL